MRTKCALAVLNAAYRLDLDDDAWLRGLAQAARGSVANEWGAIVASIAEPCAEGFQFRARVVEPENRSFLGAVQAMEATIPAAAAAVMHRRTVCQTASEFTAQMGLGKQVLRSSYASGLHPLGVRDAFNVQGTDVTQSSVVFTIPLCRETTIGPRVRHAWNRVAAHLAAALRLRETLCSGWSPAQAIDAAEALIEPSGRCVHASGPARSPSARERLRLAALAVDRAQCSQQSDPDQALELWRALFAGRWSLLETFDTDGRRFLLAMENEPWAVGDRALTRREQQVAALAAMGESDDLIGYSLGLSSETARTHLRRAMKKLGVSSRMQLVQLAATLLGDASRAATGRTARS